MGNVSLSGRNQDSERGSGASAADCLYPAMRADMDEVKPQRPPGMDPHEYALRQLYPSMYGAEWMEKFYEREKDYWD